MSNNKKRHKGLILIVDDEVLISETIYETTCCLGLRSVVFTKPVELISYVSNSKEIIDLIITDYHMPDMTGLEMIKKVHQNKLVPYILISGDIQSIKDEYCKSELARVAKPFKIDTVINLISTFYADTAKAVL